MKFLRFFAPSLLAPVLVFGGLGAWPRMSALIRSLWVLTMLAAVAIIMRGVLRDAALALHTPPVWDFQCFWLYGRVALTSHAIYDPAALHAAARSLPPNAQFSREVLDTGFPYPPFTIPLVAPLGLFANPAAALPLWYGVNAAAAVAAVIVAWRGFFRRYGTAGLLGCALLVAGFGTVATNAAMGQDTLLLLLFVLLVALDRVPSRRGIWIALACMIKPLAVVLMLYPLLKRSWRELAAAAGTLAVLFAAACGIAGPQNVLAYFTNPPYARAVPWVYTEITNQSLLAAILRATGQHAAHYSPLQEPLYLVAAFVLLAASVFVCIHSKASQRDLCIGALIAVALVVYPASQSFYSVVLLVPVWTVWRHRALFGPYADAFALGFAALIFALGGSHDGTMAIAGSLLAFVVCAVLLVNWQRVRAMQHLPAVGFAVAAALFSVAAFATIARETRAQGISNTFYCAGKAVDRGEDPYRTEPLRACEHALHDGAAVLPSNWVEPAPLPGYTLAVFGLAARLPFQLEAMLFVLASIAATLAAVIALARLIAWPPIAVLLGWAPLSLLNVSYGETPIFCATATVFAGYFLVKRRWVAAGIAGAISLLEPHMGLPVFLALLVCAPRSRIALVSSAGVLAAISILVLGIGRNIEYVSVVLPMHAVSELVANDQYSLSRVLHLAGASDTLALRLGSLSYIVLIVIGVFAGRRAAKAYDAPELLVFVPSAAALFGGLFVHDYQMIGALPAAFVLAAKSAYRAPAYAALAALVMVWSQSPSRAMLLLNVLAVAATGAVIFAGSTAVKLSRAFGCAALLGLIFVLVHRADAAGPRAGTAPFAAGPATIASQAWGEFLRATPSRIVPTWSVELQKIPTWLALPVLLCCASLRRRNVAFGPDLTADGDRDAKMRHRPGTKWADRPAEELQQRLVPP